MTSAAIYPRACWVGRSNEGPERPGLAFFRYLRIGVSRPIAERGLTPDPSTIKIIRHLSLLRCTWGMSMKSKEPLNA
jgi:hypothetical protein